MDTIKPDHLSKTITVEIRDIYGKQTIYPVCDKARTFAELTGTKTLTDRHIEIIKRLGYTIITTQREWRKP